MNSLIRNLFYQNRWRLFSRRGKSLWLASAFVGYFGFAVTGLVMAFLALYDDTDANDAKGLSIAVIFVAVNLIFNIVANLWTNTLQKHRDEKP